MSKPQKPITAKEASSIAAQVTADQVEVQKLDPDQCSNCVCFVFHRDEKVGRCHHGPPVALGTAASTSNRAWPVILAEDHCFQHRRTK